MSISYPAKIDGKEGDYVMTFRDIPEAITGGATIDIVLANAVDCLATAIEFYVDDRRPLPIPSSAENGDILVELPPQCRRRAVTAPQPPQAHRK
ncbi:hypothetical protein [Stenotrophomonas sp.]|uniref:type II toxin-antitoxin system HicB family antitoxin n=1 Tax=Stenotrophomonas sp. TaxID=69392 RepID=UPI0028ADC52D|nr:hypothetical protein [Stenotrophomonas sp.]